MAKSKMVPGSGTVSKELAVGIPALTGETNTYKTAGPYPATHSATNEFSQVGALTGSTSQGGNSLKVKGGK